MLGRAGERELASSFPSSSRASFLSSFLRSSRPRVLRIHFRIHLLLLYYLANSELAFELTKMDCRKRKEAESTASERRPPFSFFSSFPTLVAL